MLQNCSSEDNFPWVLSNHQPISSIWAKTPQKGYLPLSVFVSTLLISFNMLLCLNFPVVSPPKLHAGASGRGSHCECQFSCYQTSLQVLTHSTTPSFLKQFLPSLSGIYTLLVFSLPTGGSFSVFSAGFTSFSGHLNAGGLIEFSSRVSFQLY